VIINNNYSNHHKWWFHQQEPLTALCGSSIMPLEYPNTFNYAYAVMMVLCSKAGSLGLRLLGMRWARWFPVAFLTDNYGWATCPRLLRSGLK